MLFCFQVKKRYLKNEQQQRNTKTNNTNKQKQRLTTTTLIAFNVFKANGINVVWLWVYTYSIIELKTHIVVEYVPLIDIKSYIMILIYW